MTYYEFPARGSEAAGQADVVRRRPARRRSPRSSATKALNGEGGILYVGSKGKLLHDTYGAQSAPAAGSRCTTSYGEPKEKLARIPHEDHEMNWVDAVKGRRTISCPFDTRRR